MREKLASKFPTKCLALFLMLGILLSNISVDAFPVQLPVSGLRLWLDATDQSTITDLNGTHPGDAGFLSTIKQWADKSGNGIVALAPVGNQPLYSPTDFNGRATAIFATNQFLDLSTVIATSTETMFIVTRMYDNGANRGPWVGDHSTELGFLNDSNRYLFETTNPNSNFLISSPAPTTDTIVVSRRSGGITTIYENGFAVLPNVSGASGISIINSVGAYTRGFGPQPRTFFGEISELLIYDRALSDSEMNAVGSYLAAKYALNTAYPSATAVEIDIRPGAFPNNINLNSKGIVPVAIFSRSDFDATTINLTTLSLAGAPVASKGNDTLKADTQDVNSDGFPDLVVDFSTEGLELSARDFVAVLTGQRHDGTSIRGSDSVRIVGPGKN